MGDRFDATMNYLFGGWTLAFTIGGESTPILPAGSTTPSPRHSMPRPMALPSSDCSTSTRTTPTGRTSTCSAHTTPLGYSAWRGATSPRWCCRWSCCSPSPGRPCIYYGDEIGMEGGREPASRAAFPLGSPRQLALGDPLLGPLIGGAPQGAPSVPSRRILRLPTGIRCRAPLVPPRPSRGTPGGCGQRRAGRGIGEHPSIGDRFETLWGFGGIATEDGITRAALGPRSAAVWRPGA